MNKIDVLWFTVIMTIAIFGMVAMLLIYHFEQKKSPRGNSRKRKDRYVTDSNGDVMRVP